MKKTVSSIGRILFPFRNIKANCKRMLGWDQLKGSASNAYSAARDVWDRDKHRKTVRQETFEQAVARLKLSESDLARRQKSFFRTSLLFLSIAVLVFLYAVNLFLSGLLLATFISLVLVAMALALAYRDHFWYTQMKHRRLGLTFKNWVDYTFRGSKP